MGITSKYINDLGNPNTAYAALPERKTLAVN